MSYIIAMRHKTSDWSRYLKMVIVKDGCWGWKGSLSHGYPQMATHKNGKTWVIRAHRYAYKAFFGEEPDELHHRCNNPECSNPFHLIPVTHTENMFYARKEFCKRGHKMTKENSYIHPKRGWRHCRACRDLSNNIVAEKRKLGIYKR